jgi:heat shock protein HslJ
MTDEQMDARLQRAGEAWRASNDATVATTHVPTDVETLAVPPARKPPRVRRTGLLASAAVVAAALVAGGTFLVANLSSGDGPPATVEAGPISLAGTTWNLVGVTDANGDDVPVAGKATLFIDDSGHLNGSDGCNSISGDVDISGATIDFGHGLATTEIACPNEVSATAEHVDALVSGDVTWSIGDDKLTLSKDGVGSLIYTRSGGANTALGSLVGHTWTLQGIEHNTSSGGSASGSSSMSDISVTFDKIGGITIKHRCYTNQGDVKIGDGTFDISNVTLETAIPCTSPTDPDEDRTNSTVDDLLTGSVQWRVQGDQLQITKDSTTLDFTGSASSEPQQPQLDGTSWTLLHDRRIVLTFFGGIDYRLNTSCHAYTGHAKIGGGTMTLYGQRDLGGADCLNTNVEQVKTFLQSGEAKWSITDGTLVIAKDKTEIDFSAS